MTLTLSGLAASALHLTEAGSINSTDRLALAHDGSRDARDPTLTIAPTQFGAEFQPGAIGLSIEAQELASQDLNTDQAPVALMRLLGPGVLRVGGNSEDRSWWTSNGEPPPAWATRIITPADLLRLRRLLAATHWQVILGVNLGHFEPARAAKEAASAERILGHHLLGIEIGNEPHSYSAAWSKLRAESYSPGDYLNEASAYADAIHAVSPSIGMYGPDLSSPPWLTAIASSPQNPFVELTAHYYPTSYSVPQAGCEGTSVPTAMDLLSPQIRQQESIWLETLAAAGKLANRAIRISETNTTASCDASGAPETGPVFASALWALDWTLRAASTGVAALNFHGSFKACTPVAFSPVCAQRSRRKAPPRVGPAPEYYGLLAARELEGGRFVPVDIGGQEPSTDITAYATVHPDGDLTLAIDNFSPLGSTPITVKAPGYGQAVSEFLAAPSVNARSDITLGRGSLKANGALRATRAKVKRSNRGLQLALGPTSAVIVTLRKSSR